MTEEVKSDLRNGCRNQASTPRMPQVTLTASMVLITAVNSAVLNVWRLIQLGESSNSSRGLVVQADVVWNTGAFRRSFNETL